MTTTTADGPDFASSSLPRHLVRGVIGFGSLIVSVALIPTVGPVSLLLLPLGVLALRGCPMCWTIGLIQTISRGRLQRTCEDGRCTLSVADRDHQERPTESVSRDEVLTAAPSTTERNLLGGPDLRADLRNPALAAPVGRVLNIS